MRAALTLYLVFITLYTNYAISTTLRLVHMGLEPFIIYILNPLESGHRQFVEVKLSAYAKRKSL